MLISCSVSYYSETASLLLPIRLSLALFFLPLCQSRILVDSTLCVACSLTLSIPLALTIHRQTHRRLQCIHPVLSACSFSSSYDDCTARLLFLILLRRLHRCGFLFIYRLLTFSFACVAVSPSFSDVLLPLPLCLSFALFLFRSLLQFIAKFIFLCIRPM
jgi:hypothetical protein